MYKVKTQNKKKTIADILQIGGFSHQYTDDTQLENCEKIHSLQI